MAGVEDPGVRADAWQQNRDLKYLGFFRVAMIKAVAYVSGLYELAKNGSGSLKPSVDSVEGTVKTVVGPLYTKLEDKPAQLLSFVDRKVDGVFHILDDFIPTYIKEKSAMAYDVVKQTPESAKNVASEVQEKGLLKTARGIYDKYEPAAERNLYEAWKVALGLPMVPQAVQMVTPSAVFGAEKYNAAVSFLKDSQLPVVAPIMSWVPLMPMDALELILRQAPKEVLGQREGEAVAAAPSSS